MIFVVFLSALGVFGVSAFAQPSNTPRDLAAQQKQVQAGEYYTGLGEAEQIRGAFSSSEANYKKGIDLLKRYAQPGDLRLAAGLDGLGWLYVTWGRFEEGSQLMEQARTKAENARQNDPALIRHLDAQAAYLVVAGRSSEAKREWKRALEVGEANYGPDAFQYDNVLLHFGQGSALLGDYDSAAEMLRRFLNIEEQYSKIPNTASAVAAGELAHIYTQLHKYSDARTWFQKATAILNGNREQAPLARSLVFFYRGDYDMEQKQWSDAESQYSQALRIQESVFGENRAAAISMLSLFQSAAEASSEKRG